MASYILMEPGLSASSRTDLDTFIKKGGLVNTEPGNSGYVLTDGHCWPVPYQGLKDMKSEYRLACSFPSLHR